MRRIIHNPGAWHLAPQNPASSTLEGEGLAGCSISRERPGALFALDLNQVDQEVST